MWLLGIFESQKLCLLNIRVRSKFSYLEYSVFLLEMCICEQSFNMRYRIFCCTGSPDSHTCVANYTIHSRNICGKFKNRRGRESFRFQRRAEIKRSILARTRLKHAFFSQNSTHSPTVWKLRYQKRAKASEEIWSTLADSDSAIFVCFLTVAIFACVSGQRTSYLFVSFFFHCSPMKIRPGQAEKNEKIEFSL